MPGPRVVGGQLRAPGEAGVITELLAPVTAAVRAPSPSDASSRRAARVSRSRALSTDPLRGATAD